MSFFTKTLLALLLIFAGAAQAAENVYECKAKHRDRYGIAPKRIIFFIDRENQTARVLDGMIQDMHGGPMAASLEKRSETSYALGWTVKNVPARGSGTLTIAYWTVVNLGKGIFTLTADVKGYANRTNGQGSCTLVQ